MRTLIATLGLVVAATAAIAETEPLRPAPVPNNSFDRGAPADRAGTNESLQRAAPFSGVPGTLSSDSGQPTPIDNGDARVRSAPSPDLSR